MHPSIRLSLGILGLILACSPDDPTRPGRATINTGDAYTAKQPPPPSSGFLDLCKEPSTGIAAGQPFTFRITLGGVIRTVTVLAGGCVRLETQLESTPFSKGHFQNTLAAVARLLPGTATLSVDGADLTSADVHAILDAAPNVSATSSLLLNLTQQLIAADLNVLRGVQPDAPVLQAMADANVALQITLGAQITLTSALTPAELSAMVKTLAAFNEGKTSVPATPLSFPIDVVELVGALAELTGISCHPASQCTGLDLAAARVTASVASGATTRVTFTNRSKPVLRVCKVAGPGIAAGRVFRFVVAGNNVNDGAILDVPAGECRDAVLTEASYNVTESGSLAGVAVSSITCDPASRCTDASLTIATATVAIPRGITTVTFTNRSALGVLRFCKVAGSGIANNGREFGMTAGGIDLNPKVGEPTTASVQVPTGDCRDATLLEGLYDVREIVPAGVAVSSITCDLATRCSDVSPALGLLKAQVVGATTTTVTFTNRATFGTLRLCKVAGTGITPGRVFQFSASANSFSGRPGEPTSGAASVPADDCRDVAPLLEGPYSVTELGPLVGVAVSAIACEPIARCSNIALIGPSVTAQIVGASLTTVTFTNRSTLAQLRVCKIAGPGVGAGIVFQFNASGNNLDPSRPEPTSANLSVPAGECREATVLEGLYDVVESNLPGVSVAAISCIPVQHCVDVSVGVRAAKVLMVGGVTTQVSFTNSASTSFNLSQRSAVPTTAQRPQRPREREWPEPNAHIWTDVPRLRGDRP